MQVYPIMLASKLACAIRRVCAIAKKLFLNKLAKKLCGILTHIVVVVVFDRLDSKEARFYILLTYAHIFLLGNGHVFSIDSQPPLSLSLFGEWASHGAGT